MEEEEVGGRLEEKQAKGEVLGVPRLGLVPHFPMGLQGGGRAWEH